MKLDKFTLAYIECALWASNDESDENGGEPLDANYSASDLAPETLEAMKIDCAAFQRDNAADIAAGPDGPDYTRYERAGHDFFLTRNHHGAGFWDGDWSAEAGERLTAASHAHGETNLYVGDDGLIYAD
jgi:hypothetical protein